MDMTIAIFLYILGLFFFLFALYEEREDKPSDDEQEKSDNLVVIFLVLSIMFLFVGGLIWFGVTQSYYSPATNTIETIILTEYRPIGWIGVAFAMVVGMILAGKVFEVFEERITNG